MNFQEMIQIEIFLDTGVIHIFYALLSWIKMFLINDLLTLIATDDIESEEEQQRRQERCFEHRMWHKGRNRIHDE